MLEYRSPLLSAKMLLFKNNVRWAAEVGEKHLSRQMSAVSPVDGCRGRQGSLIVSGSPLNLGKCELMDGKAARTKEIPPASCLGQTEWFYSEVRCHGELQKAADIYGKRESKSFKGLHKRTGVLERPKISTTWT